MDRYSEYRSFIRDVLDPTINPRFHRVEKKKKKKKKKRKRKITENASPFLLTSQQLRRVPVYFFAHV